MPKSDTAHTTTSVAPGQPAAAIKSAEEIVYRSCQIFRQGCPWEIIENVIRGSEAWGPDEEILAIIGVPGFYPESYEPDPDLYALIRVSHDIKDRMVTIGEHHVDYAGLDAAHGIVAGVADSLAEPDSGERDAFYHPDGLRS